MSIVINRAVSHLPSRLQPLLQTSRVSSRQFSIGPIPPLGNRLATSLATFSEVRPKYTFKNTIHHTSHKPNLGYLAAAIVASIASWLFSALFNTSQAEGSVAVSAAEEAAAIAEKHGVMWECIGRTPDEFGGYIYHFKLRKEFDYQVLELILEEMKGEVTPEDIFKARSASSNKYDETFPAFEPRRLRDILQTVRILSHRRFKDFGYGVRQDKSGTYFDAPDDVSLHARYEKKRETNPVLKPLKIFSPEGDLDEMAFSAGFVNYDCILARKKEFVHDHLFHVLPTLYFKLSFPEEYAIERKRLGELIGALHRSLINAEHLLDKESDFKKQLPKIKTILGTAVDFLWGFRTLGRLEEWNENSFEAPLLETFLDDNDQFEDFWEDKFGEDFDNYAFQETWKNFWEHLRTLEKQTALEQKIHAVATAGEPW